MRLGVMKWPAKNQHHLFSWEPPGEHVEKHVLFVSATLIVFAGVAEALVGLSSIYNPLGTVGLGAVAVGAYKVGTFLFQNMYMPYLRNKWHTKLAIEEVTYHLHKRDDSSLHEGVLVQFRLFEGRPRLLVLSPRLKGSTLGMQELQNPENWMGPTVPHATVLRDE